MDEHDKGLAHDLDALGRRRVLLGAAGLAATTLLAVWSSGREAGASGTGDSTDTCTASAEETEGPFPADGSNTVAGSVSNALALTGIVRSDIRASFGGMSGTAAGVATTLRLTLVDANAGCAGLAGYAIYVWHCDRDGEYSLYDAATQNWLRGVQRTDAAGVATFTTIFPGCYAGRMPHIHIEVYRGTAAATSAANKLGTTQLAFPTGVCETVYTMAPGYGASAANFARISFATDDVFSDGVSTEMATVTGNVNEGYVVALRVGIRA